MGLRKIALADLAIMDGQTVEVVRGIETRASTTGRLSYGTHTATTVKVGEFNIPRTAIVEAYIIGGATERRVLCVPPGYNLGGTH